MQVCLHPKYIKDKYIEKIKNYKHMTLNGNWLSSNELAGEHGS